MTIRKGDIKRPDKRIAVAAQTLAYLFDVSVSQIEKAEAEGRITAREAFGVKRYHVDSIERVFFGDEGKVSPAEETDPFLEALKGPHGPSSKKRRGSAS